MMKKLFMAAAAFVMAVGVFANTGGNVNKSKLEDVKAIFNEKNCDLVLHDYFTTCYNFERRSAVAVYTEVEGSKVAGEGIDKRPSFYTDKRIPKGYEITTQDYSNTGYDRGHFGASDASFDWDQKALESSYKMSNIVPQTPRANRYKFVALEKHERAMAVEHGVLETVSIAFWNDRPKKIGENEMHVPSAFAKVFTSTKDNYRECFFIWNNDDYDNADGQDPNKYKKDCKEIFAMVGTKVGKAPSFSAADEKELKRLLEFYSTTELNKQQKNSIQVLLNSFK
jgi:endonuclease G